MKTRRTELGNRYALSALKEKRATLAGEILALNKTLAWKKEQLSAVDATLAIFNPNYRSDEVRPIRFYKTVHLFKQGELARAVLDALREAGKPVGIPAVKVIVMRTLGMDESKERAMHQRVRASLEYLDRRGRVLKTGSRATALWELAEGVEPETAFPIGANIPRGTGRKPKP